MSDIAAVKRARRAELRARLQALPPSAFVQAGVCVAAHLASVLPVRGMVAAFAARADEVQTAPLLAALRARGLGIALPRIDGDALSFILVDDDVALLPRDRSGIAVPPADRAPVAVANCALVLVPGLGFDSRGGRLGHGRGYYDRVLRDPVVRARAIGVFLDEQRLDHVPCAGHDVRLLRLCTPNGGLLSVVEE
jgi:5-formyltetrahydrofolate cyclo-ligase